MTCGVYGLFDDETDECLYVGLSTGVLGRWKNHLRNLKNGKHRRMDFVVWFRERGNDPSAIRWEILEECSPKELNATEIKWFLKSGPKFVGQRPSLNYRWELSDETKKKISGSVRKFNAENYAINPLLKYSCKECKKSFESRRENRVYCSQGCFAKSIKPRIKADEELGVRMRKLYEVEEMTMKEMSLILGFSDATVHRFMVEFNIPRRVPGDTKIPRKPVTDLQRENASKTMKLLPKIPCEFCGDDFKSGGAMEVHQRACSVNGSPT